MSRPGIRHGSKCRRGEPTRRLSWAGWPELHCPGCGRTAPDPDGRPVVVAAFLSARTAYRDACAEVFLAAHALERVDVDDSARRAGALGRVQRAEASRSRAHARLVDLGAVLALLDGLEAT